jgi:asparagine synthase (glutamine-hydrolysing)
MPNGELARSVQLMSGSLEHRGPDDEGCWVDEQRGVALGFQRLSIIDLSLHGHQPMHSPSGRYTLVFNGEIYNYRLLRQELRSAGVRYEGDSDTSVVVAAFDAWGIRSAVQRFNGMFAMAVWDRQEGHLTLVRDRLGIKPLFIHWKSGLFTFGSELRAIMHGPAFQATIDRAALRLFLRYLYVPAPQAILENVHKLPPGHLLTVCEPNEPLPRSEPFWSLDRTATHGVAHRFDGDPQEAVEHLEELLRDSVSQRMQADVPPLASTATNMTSRRELARSPPISARSTQACGSEARKHWRSCPIWVSCSMNRWPIRRSFPRGWFPIWPGST